MFRTFRFIWAFCACSLWATVATPQSVQLPLVFEPNQGQTDPRVQYLSRTSAYTLFLTKDGATLQPQHGASVSLRFEHAAPQAAAKLLDRLPGISNYFTGPSAKDWHTGIPQYGRVQYRNLYPGIDLVFYGHDRE